jgi:adenylate kinase family enzyme
MQRIAIIGPGGAGKSTLARELGALTGLPVIHLDAEHWQPGWVEPSREAWQARVREMAAGSRWIMDGNFGGTMAERLARADTVIFLDFPRLLCIRRVLGRQLRYFGRTRPDMARDCPEHFSLSFLRWIWEYPQSTRPKVLDRMRTSAATRRLVLRSPREVTAFLAAVRDGEGSGSAAAPASGQ